MTPAPPVSVIVPVGAVDEHLPVQLDALARQRFEGRWELVVSLNTDDPDDARAVRALLDERPALPAIVVDSSSVRSAAHARNVGAAAAAGELLLFCDGDDVADREWLAGLVTALAEAEVVGGHLDEELLAIPDQAHWRPPATPGALPTFLGRPYVVSANLGIRREAFELVGAFDTTLIRGEDIALSWDLLDHGIDPVYVPGAVIHYRHRRGLAQMMRQHYLYGRGFSQILARRGLPGADDGPSALAALRPNSQPVDVRGPAYFLRRGSIAAGRLVGLVEERRLQRRAAPQ